MSLAIDAAHLTLSVDQYRGVENPIACFRLQSKYNTAGTLARPGSESLRYGAQELAREAG
jgi:hypothetical protein